VVAARRTELPTKLRIRRAAPTASAAFIRHPLLLLAIGGQFLSCSHTRRTTGWRWLLRSPDLEPPLAIHAQERHHGIGLLMNRSSRCLYALHAFTKVKGHVQLPKFATGIVLEHRRLAACTAILLQQPLKGNVIVG
jgi:hypothetical protein